MVLFPFKADTALKSLKGAGVHIKLPWTNKIKPMVSAV